MALHRISLSDEDLDWICTGLNSLAKAGKQSDKRREALKRLAERLMERRPGNPRVILGWDSKPL